MTLGRITVFICIIAIVGYVGFHLQSLLSAPLLELSSPPQGLTTANKTIEIKGKTEPGAVVNINEAPLPTPQSGEFSHLLVLSPGVNTIKVTAKKRYSKSAVIERQIFILNNESISQREINKL